MDQRYQYNNTPNNYNNTPNTGGPPPGVGGPPPGVGGPPPGVGGPPPGVGGPPPGVGGPPPGVGGPPPGVGGPPPGVGGPPPGVGGPPPGVGGPPPGVGGPPPGVGGPPRGAGGPPPRAGGPGGPRGPMGGPPVKAKKGTMKRLIKLLFSEYKFMLIIEFIAMGLYSVIGVAPSIYVEKFASVIEHALKEIGINHYTEISDFKKVFAGFSPEITKLLTQMIILFIIGIAASAVYTRIGAIVTQGFLGKMRKKMFAKMQSLPIKYFDTHNHGDIMSHYTNDIDTLRQMISQSLPSLISAFLSLGALIFLMLYYSVWLTLIVIAGIFTMSIFTKKIGGNSAKFFMKQQMSIGRCEGYIEEMMNGQKVIKVFCHEEAAEKEFDKLNEQLCQDATNANRFANILMPIMNNIGNILYVTIAFAGGAIVLNNVFSPSISSLFTHSTLMDVSIVVTFLGMTRQFCQNVSQVSQQINSVVMALAGADRIFTMLDEQPETDDGYVTLTNASYRNDTVMESSIPTGKWAWKHPHQNTSVTLTPMNGDIVFDYVDFGYVPEKMVLTDITLHAEPGQKIALVGSTGAGKTTITNLINRFYDLADGKVRYDGININKIKKSDLRRSLGMVLQDVNLFTGTVLDNIRYGKLDASDQECIEAAKLANADGFIQQLPDGYHTVLKGDGSGLSQGQRQLISIARAAIANPPVMILDEATSSIDTRTEAIVQKGMDALMKGRTVFVIAHRLSTIKNSDMILVMDHGRIIERGNHDQLIAAHGLYYRLYTGAFELN